MSLCALCDTDATVRARLESDFADVPTFATHSELIASGAVDAVIISTPHYYHPPIAIDAFEAGLHVLTEKPAGVDCASVREMCEAAKRSGKTFGVMFNQRANKLFAEAKRIMDSGELGELRRMVWIITNWYRKQEYYDSGEWRATWSGEGGGVLINQAPYNLDLWQWLCGMPEKLRAECYVSKHHQIEVEDDATIFAEYANGASATFITSTGDYPGTNRLEITGSAGKIVLENKKLTHYKLSMDEREYRLTQKGVVNEITISEMQDEKYNCHCVILQNFADASLSGAPLIASGYDAIFELMLSNAAYLSAWTDKKITLPADETEFLRLLEQRKALSAAHKATQGRDANGRYHDRWNTNW
jgi:predicted dehydrogenase